MGIMRRLYESRPFLGRIPDQSLVTAGQQLAGSGHIQAGRDGTRGKDDASFLMVYFPRAGEAEIDTGRLAGETVRGWWFDPRTGTAAEIGTFPKTRSARFATPKDHTGRDWLLVLDDAAAGYGPPGA